VSFKQIFSLFLVVILFTVASFLIGCAGTDRADESDAGSIEASPAKNSPDEAGKEDDKGKKKGKPRTKAEKKTYYQNTWRTWQMSDHFPLWVELEIDFSDSYLKRIRQEV